jgi:hypothetical protein
MERHRKMAIRILRCQDERIAFLLSYLTAVLTGGSHVMSHLENNTTHDPKQQMTKGINQLFHTCIFISSVSYHKTQCIIDTQTLRMVSGCMDANNRLLDGGSKLGITHILIYKG